jgi:hypothetical protein
MTNYEKTNKLSLYSTIALSSLFFSNGLSQRVQKFDSDLFMGKGENVENRSQEECETPFGTFPGFVLQAAMLAFSNSKIGDKNKIIKELKHFIEVAGLSGFAFALGATNLSNRVKNE